MKNDYVLEMLGFLYFLNPVILYTNLPMKMEQCSETSAYKIQTPGNYPEENLQHSEHGENLNSTILLFCHPALDTFVMQLTVPSYFGFNEMGQAAETNDKQSYVIRAGRRTLSTNSLASPFLIPAATKDR